MSETQLLHGLEGFRLDTPAVVDVFAEVLKRGPIARIEIAKRTGLSQASVTKAVTPLIGRGLLSAHDSMRLDQRGRPVQPISVNEKAQFAIGIDVTPSEIYGVVTTLRANVVTSIHRSLPAMTVSAIVDAVTATVRSLLDGFDGETDRLMGVGVAVSGDVDKPNGIVRSSPRLNWSDVPFERLLRERLGLPVVIDNDVRGLAIAEEWFGIGVDAGSFAIVTIGSGIGCGLYVNGDVVEGAYGVAGEVGHLPLGPAELICSCGRNGCVETVASSSAILQSVRASKHDPLISMREAVQLARSGDADAVTAFERAATVIGLALATMANLVGPEVILVAGESVVDYDVYEQRIRDTFDKHTFASAGDCRIVTQSHTFENWARGAAASLIRANVLLAR